MPTCSNQRSKLDPGTSCESKKDILLLDFPQNAGVRWNKNCPPPNQYKGIYTWTSTPRALYTNRKLIRENLNLQRESQPCQNLMYDRRVVRGSNFASTNLQVAECENIRKEEEAKRRQILRKRQVSRNQRGVIGTPPPVKGRKHETIQTEKYLEELFSRPPEIEQSCQTDLFLQRPPTPLYVTAKIGVDASTEIVDGELFDFDNEVHTILESLIGTTLQQALTEVVHEEEIADLREQQHKMLANREVEMAELRRLESKEIMLQSEKTRCKFEEDEREVMHLQLNQRITAAKLLQGHIADLLPSVLESIESVRDAENKEDLQQKLTPWLAEEVASEIGQMVDSQELLLEIVKEVLQHRAEIYANFEQDDDM
ncbi:hypothetical protein ACKWTF_004385 [Chironomus riparius]